MTAPCCPAACELVERLLAGWFRAILHSPGGGGVAMPYRITDFRSRAEFCRRQSQIAIDDSSRQQWLLFAKSWEEFADNISAASGLKLVHGLDVKGSAG